MKKTDLPNSINIGGVLYKIIYCDNPAEVDPVKREALWGTCDYWSRTIRVYKNGRSIEDIYQTIMHEILHAIGEQYHIKMLEDEDNHEQLDLLSAVIMDVLVRNEWMKF